MSDAIAIRAALLAWYRECRRDLPWRRTNDPYRIWVSEVMLQQTQVATVIPYFDRFIERFPDIEALAGADDEAVLKAWEGLGYYARVHNLQRAAREVAQKHEGRIPSTPDQFRALPGVGDYICAAVQSIAFGHPLAVVDGNVKRVLARVFSIDAPVNASASQKLFRQHADALLDHDAPSDFNQAMMELGALVCRPTTPLCGQCPLAPHCAAAIDGQTERYPVKAPKKSVPQYHVAVGVVENDGRMLITRRPPQGLLGGLWEFPGGKVRDGEPPETAAEREIREETGLDVNVTAHITHVHHAYSHFKVEIDVFRCRLHGPDHIHLNGPTDYRWIVREEIPNYAFPKANHKFIPLLLDPDTP